MSYVHSICLNRYQHVVLMRSTRTIEKAEIQCFGPFFGSCYTSTAILSISSAELPKLRDRSYIKQALLQERERSQIARML